MSKIIGIDLGTSNSAAAVLEGGKPKIIPSAEGNTMYGKAFPSVIAFTKTGQMLVGEPARRQAVTNPDGTFSAFKRQMGNDYKYKNNGKEYSPQELSAYVLQKIKKDAEEFLGYKVEKAVVTVPAYFNDNQRQATKDAGKIAGLEIVRIINEPTAAALAYGLNKTEQEQKIIVFDLGGGTLDVTIMDFGDGVFEVISTSGDTSLGGEDMDKSILDYLLKEFKNKENVDLSGDTTAMKRLKEAAEKAKIELSTTLETDINLPFIGQKDGQPLNFQLKMSRAKLEDLVRPIVNKCKTSINQALQDAKLGPDQIDRVIMVGGPTRMPIVKKFVEDSVSKKVERGIDPMECVAMGAAIQAGVLTGDIKDLVLLDVTPLSLGIETLGGVFTKLIDRNTTIPTKKQQTFSTAADSQPSVDIKIYQGERQMAKDNVELGNFQLTGLPPAPRGMPQIEVTFDIDSNGILHVTAKDLGTNKEQKITITAPHKMNEEEIKKKMKEAEDHADDDKKRRDLVESKNEGENMIYTTKKTLDEFKDKVKDDVKKKIEEKVKEVEEALKTDDVKLIKEKTEALTKEIQQVGAQIYQEAQKNQQNAEQNSDGSYNTDYKKESDNEGNDSENKEESNTGNNTENKEENKSETNKEETNTETKTEDKENNKG